MFGLLTRFLAAQGRSLEGELLDVGCGNGHTLRYFAQQACGRLRLTGLDFSKEGIQLARSQTDGAELHCADFLSWKAGNEFDFVISLGVFEHFPDPRPALHKAAAFLKQ